MYPADVGFYSAQAMLLFNIGQNDAAMAGTLRFPLFD